MSAKQGIPKKIIAIAVLLISLFIIQVIVQVILVSIGYEEGMPNYFWAIGGTTLILGIIILIYGYRKSKAGGYSEPTVSEGAVTPSITLDISDGKLFRSHLIIFIVILILDSLLFGLALAPFATRSTRITNIVVGVILLFAAILNIIIYAVKPKGMRQRYYDKRVKKAAKKEN